MAANAGCADGEGQTCRPRHLPNLPILRLPNSRSLQALLGAMVDGQSERLAHTATLMPRVLGG